MGIDPWQEGIELNRVLNRVQAGFRGAGGAPLFVLQTAILGGVGVGGPPGFASPGWLGVRPYGVCVGLALR